MSTEENKEGKLLLERDITCGDIEHDQIAQYLLQFCKSKWNFENPEVTLYRTQSSNINHQSLVSSNPILMTFPQYFSNIPYQPNEYVVLTIYQPQNRNKCFELKVSIKGTTCKQLIDLAVKGLSKCMDETNIGHTNNIFQMSSEFILKLIGAEEYILYDEKKQIIDYEAIRKVSNSKNVLFKLLHFPNIAQMKQECEKRNTCYIAQWYSRYFTANLLTDKILRKQHKQCGYKISLLLFFQRRRRIINHWERSSNVLRQQRCHIHINDHIISVILAFCDQDDKCESEDEFDDEIENDDKKSVGGINAHSQ